MTATFRNQATGRSRDLASSEALHCVKCDLRNTSNLMMLQVSQPRSTTTALETPGEQPQLSRSDDPYSDRVHTLLPGPPPGLVTTPQAARKGQPAVGSGKASSGLPTKVAERSPKKTQSTGTSVPEDPLHPRRLGDELGVEPGQALEERCAREDRMAEDRRVEQQILAQRQVADIHAGTTRKESMNPV